MTTTPTTRLSAKPVMNALIRSTTMLIARGIVRSGPYVNTTLIKIV